ncbi:MAG: DUF4910 domain-containing protein [Solirubrobacterales bacterium]|nr:DUF4910 domain-containing protein [Solirubrobacterales bacterium]
MSAGTSAGVPAVVDRAREGDGLGERTLALMRDLFPLCRSLTGDGVRETLRILRRDLPLEIHEVPTGTPVFDWTVPEEWNIRAAHITGPDGRRIVDLRDSPLHVVSYSEPVDARMSLKELLPHLHSLPDEPDLIPYRTSYWARTWGFCLAHRTLRQLTDGEYRVVIDSTLRPGHLTYGELELPGERDEEILITTYVCHPSLANDNVSGIAMAAMLARELSGRRLRRRHRFLFAPATIGPLTWLAASRDRWATIHSGFTVACIGDDGPLTYKRTRDGNAELDLAAEVALRDAGIAHRLVDFEPWGGDERQFSSPGFGLRFGALSRTAHAAYPGNHTSADDLPRIRPDALQASLHACLGLVDALEGNGTWRNLSPFGEPQLGRRGLYDSAGGKVGRGDERALLWVLNQSDGTRSLLEIARRSQLPFATVQRAAQRLRDAELLAELA